MKFWILALVSCACTGCTMMSLERHTLAQTESAIDLRYREVMENLAKIAHDPSTLPSYSSLYAGAVTVTDQEELISTTIWQHATAMPVQNGFGSEAANPMVNRTVLQNWALDRMALS